MTGREKGGGRGAVALCKSLSNLQGDGGKQVKMRTGQNARAEKVSILAVKLHAECGQN